MWATLITNVVLFLIDKFVTGSKRKEEMTRRYYDYIREREKRTVKMHDHKKRADELRLRVKKRLKEYAAQNNQSNN